MKSTYPLSFGTRIGIPQGHLTALYLIKWLSFFFSDFFVLKILLMLLGDGMRSLILIGSNDYDGTLVDFWWNISAIFRFALHIREILSLSAAKISSEPQRCFDRAVLPSKQLVSFPVFSGGILLHALGRSHEKVEINRSRLWQHSSHLFLKSRGVFALPCTIIQSSLQPKTPTTVHEHPCLSGDWSSEPIAWPTKPQTWLVIWLRVLQPTSPYGSSSYHKSRVSCSIYVACFLSKNKLRFSKVTRRTHCS